MKQEIVSELEPIQEKGKTDVHLIRPLSDASLLWEYMDLGGKKNLPWWVLCFPISVLDPQHTM